LIKPFIDYSQFPLPKESGYAENHVGGTESFPISIASGVIVKHEGSVGRVNIWSSASQPPAALFRLHGVTSGTAAVTKLEDLFFFGALRGIEIADTNKDGVITTDFTGLIARCQFGGNQIAIDFVNKTTLAGDLAIRGCKIRSDLVTFPGPTPPPVIQTPSVGFRFHALANDNPSDPPIVNVEIRNLRLVGNFSVMNPSGVGRPGTHDISGGNGDFSRLVEVYTEGNGVHLEHSPPAGFAPIPSVNLEFIGGDLQGKADPNNTTAGWDVGVFASTGQQNGVQWRDFIDGYRIDFGGTIIDSFKLAGIHGVSTLWGRGVVTLNGNTIVRNTGKQATSSPTNDVHNGIHITSIEAYMALHATDANVPNNLGNGIYLRTLSSISDDAHAAPTGNFINLENCSIFQNGGNGIAMQVDADGIVGGAWHFINNTRSLRKIPGVNYSVDYGQGIVNGCAISNNGKAGLYFRPTTSSTYVSTRFTNDIIWNNPNGGYLADLTGEDNRPVFLAPLGHCTLAGNGDSANYPYSLEIIEENRAAGDNGIYFWTDFGGILTTKFYNTVLERKSSSAIDFAPGMISGSTKFLIDDTSSPGNSEIGAAGLRYQDGGGLTLFAVSTRDSTPFVNSSSWTTLDPSRFYLLNLGNSGVFGQTPTIFPLVGNETAFDHEGDLRPVASGGTRDKGADEL
jgi:hypothetical protein